MSRTEPVMTRRRAAREGASFVVASDPSEASVTAQEVAPVKASTDSRPSADSKHQEAKAARPPIWWSNAIAFCAIHLIAASAFAMSRPGWRPLVLFYLNWQLATLGITLGYHRLWSHRSYTAMLPLRVIYALCGTLGFQGSIKWWVVRHRLHHRFTDTDSDPYSADRGLFFSHMGWIFVKPHYPKLKLIDQRDLLSDPVVRFQHKYFVPLALSLGFILPAVVGKLWFDDAWLGALWGGFVARVAIWHCTFLINSLAHYIGDQFYATDISARGNFVLAVLTNGEGFHNYHHSFPSDYRNGIKALDWDPTKWIIHFLHRYTKLVPSIRQISTRDIDRARARVALSHSPMPGLNAALLGAEQSVALPRLTRVEAKRLYADRPVIVLDGYAVDVEHYMHEHPGGEGLLRAYSGARDATKTFATLNYHTAHARALVEDMRIAEIVDGQA